MTEETVIDDELVFDDIDHALAVFHQSESVLNTRAAIAAGVTFVQGASSSESSSALFSRMTAAYQALEDNKSDVADFEAVQSKYRMRAQAQEIAAQRTAPKASGSDQPFIPLIL